MIMAMLRSAETWNFSLFETLIINALSRLATKYDIIEYRASFQDRSLPSQLLAVSVVRPFSMSTCQVLSAQINAMTIWKSGSISVWISTHPLDRLLSRPLEQVVYSIRLTSLLNTCSNMSKTIFWQLNMCLSESLLSFFQQIQKRCKVCWYNRVISNLWLFSPYASSFMQLSIKNLIKCVPNTRLHCLPSQTNRNRWLMVVQLRRPMFSKVVRFGHFNAKFKELAIAIGHQAFHTAINWCR